jgi:hypothetical protein
MRQIYLCGEFEFPLTYVDIHRNFAHEETHYSLAPRGIAGTTEEVVAQDWRTDGRTVPAGCRSVSEAPKVGEIQTLCESQSTRE